MENADLVKELFAKVVEDHVKARSSYHPEDGVRPTLSGTPCSRLIAHFF